MIGLLKQEAVFYGITNPEIEVRDYKSRIAEITIYGILKSSVCKIQIKNDWFAKTRSRFLWDYKSQDRGSRLQISNSGDYDLRDFEILRL